MWFVLLKFYVFKTLSIFVFIVVCVTTFLMVMYNSGVEELRKCILPKNVHQATEFLPENRECVDDKLEVLAEKLTEKERMLERSQCEIKNAEKVLSDLENKTSTCRVRYKSLMIELKKDVRKTEDEVKQLQNQVSNLSFRREKLRNEVVKQQEDYQRMLNNFTKELEDKKTLFCTTIEKSRRHPRVSCFGLS